MSTHFADMTTADIVTACEAVYTELGYRDAGTVERWEQDGVMLVSAGGTDWTLEVSGKDNPYFEPGGTMRPDDDRADYDDGYEVTSLEEFRAMLLAPPPAP